MSVVVPQSPNDCIAAAGAAAIAVGELARREWPARGSRRTDDAVLAHTKTLLEGVAALPPDEHMTAIMGMIVTLLHACVAAQQEALLRSNLGRQGL